jgi:hypothetical protein
MCCPMDTTRNVPACRRAVVNAAVAQVHHETGIGELRLREPYASQPREIAGAAQQITRQVARDDLVLPLVQFLRLEPGLDGNHLRLRGDFGEALRRQAHDDISVAEQDCIRFRPVANCHWPIRVSVAVFASGSSTIWMVNVSVSRRLRLAIRVHEARVGMDFVIVGISAFPLDKFICASPRFAFCPAPQRRRRSNRRFQECS